MQIAIAGGTTTLAAETARVLEARGHVVRDVSALDGVDVVIDTTHGTRDTGRLLRAAAAAGVAHHVGVSSVGIDSVGGPYARAKLEQEALIRRSRLPWTIVRATQFHTLVARTFAASARLGVVPSAYALLQPVDPGEVARVLADTAEAEPSRAITQFAGPEVLSVSELARRWLRGTGSRARPLRLPAPAVLRAGGLTHRGAWLGRVTFDAWLAAS